MKTILSFLIILSFMITVSAVDFTPQGNINLRDTYNITGAPYVNATLYYGNGSQLTGITTGDANYSSFSNLSYYWNSYNIVSDLNYLILSYWNNITGRPTLLSNFTDDLGDRGYTSNLNFTNDAGYYNSSDFNISDYALNSSLDSYYLKPTSFLTVLGFLAGIGNVATDSTMLGYGSGTNNNGTTSTMLGYYAGFDNSGDRLVAVGQSAAQLNNADRVTAVGYNSAQSNTGERGSFFGYLSGKDNDGIYGTGIGAFANNENTGNYVTSLGYSAGYQNTGANSVFLGHQAGLGNSDSNVFILKHGISSADALITGNFATGNIVVNENVTATTFIGDLSEEPNLNVNSSSFANSSTYWDDETSQADLNVNSSNWWAGLTGWVSGWFQQDGNDINFNETKLNETGDLRYVNVDGDTMTGALNIYNDLYVGNDTFIENGRLFVGPLANTSQAATNPGDSVFRGNMIISDSLLQIIPGKYQLAFQVLQNGDDDPGKSTFYLNFSGELNVSTELFCDYLNNPFKSNDTLNVVVVVYSAEFITDNIYLVINSFVNSSCVIVETGIFGGDAVTELTTVAYVVFPQPTFGILDGGIILNGISMYYDSNTSSDQFGSYTRENTLQNRPGGNLFADAFTDEDGNLEYAYGSQTGLNNSGGFSRNSQFISSTTGYSTAEKQNLTLLHDIFWRWDKRNISNKLDYDSASGGADLGVEHGIETLYLYLHRLLSVEGDVNFDMQGEDFNIFNGSILLQTPVTFEQGFTEGEEVEIFNAKFSGVLSPFVNIQTDSGNWEPGPNGLCNDGQCANSNGISGNGDIIMQNNASTSNVNETKLSFVYSIVGLVAANDFVVTVNNNSGSGDVVILTDAGTETLISEVITLPAGFDNISKITINFDCGATSVLRDCFVDDVKLNGTAISTTLINVSGFDSIINMDGGDLDSSGYPIRGIFYNAENDTIYIRGNVSQTTIDEADLIVTDTITFKSETISYWANLTQFIPNMLLTDGSRALTANWAQGAVNFTDTDSWFLGKVDASTIQNPIWRLQSWDNITGIPHATPSNGDVTHFSLADEIYDWAVGLFMQDLVDDTTPQLGGDLNTTTHDIYVPVGSNVYFGTSKIFNNGTNLIIQG